MTEAWASASVDLHLNLTGARIREALERALRDAVRTGRLTPGLQLPSSRALAADLGIARNTVTDAYSQLVAEGWLTARQGAGTRVADRSAAVEAATAPAPLASRPQYDLRAGSPDTAAFPRAAWLAATRVALIAAPAEALGYTCCSNYLTARLNATSSLAPPATASPSKDSAPTEEPP